MDSKREFFKCWLFCKYFILKSITYLVFSSFHFRFVLFQVFVTPSSSSFKHNLKDHKDDVNILNNSIIAAMTTGFCLLPIFLQIFIGLHERGFHGVIHLGFFVCILPLKIFNCMCSSVQVCACLMLTNLIIQVFTILFKWLYSKKKFIYRINYFFSIFLRDISVLYIFRTLQFYLSLERHTLLLYCHNNHVKIQHCIVFEKKKVIWIITKLMMIELQNWCKRDLRIENLNFQNIYLWRTI